MNWEDKLKKQAEGFYIGLGDLQSETSFMDGVNYATDKIMGKIKEMKEEIKPKEKEVFYGSPEYYEWVACIGMLTNLIQWIEGGSE